MKNKLIRSLSLCMVCLTLILLLNVVIQENNLKIGTPTKAATIMHIDEWPPW